MGGGEGGGVGEAAAVGLLRSCTITCHYRPRPFTVTPDICQGSSPCGQLAAEITPAIGPEGGAWRGLK